MIINNKNLNKTLQFFVLATLVGFYWLFFLLFQELNLDGFVLLSVVPIKIYANADSQKTEIIEDNKKKEVFIDEWITRTENFI